MDFALCARWIGLPERFAPCPPHCALLLYLRKTLRQPNPGHRVFVRQSQPPSFAAAGTVCLPQRSQGGARRAGDMSGGGYTGAVAGTEKTDPTKLS
jgi:hypothetical protein